MNLPTTTKKAQAAAVMDEIAILRVQLAACTRESDRIALEEDIEDLRQDYIELMHY